MAKPTDKPGDKPVPKADEGPTVHKVDRPAVTTGPGGMAPPPGSLGDELARQQTDDRPRVSDASTAAPGDPGPGGRPIPSTNAANPDGQNIRAQGAPKQPERPDLSTQQPRDAGGSDVSATHPDRPDMGAEDVPVGTEDESLRAARERARKGAGNVYQTVPGKVITGQTSDPDGWKGHVTESDFPDGTDFDRLVRMGYLVRLEGLKADPRKARELGREGQEEVDRLHEENAKLREEVERAKADKK